MKLNEIFVSRTINSIKLQGIHFCIIDIYVSGNQGVNCLYRIYRCTKFCLKNFNVRNIGFSADLIFFIRTLCITKFQNIFSYHPQLSDSKFTCDRHGGLRLAVSCWIMGLLDRNVRHTIEKKFISDR